MILLHFNYSNKKELFEWDVWDNLELLKSTYFQLQFENLKKNFKEIKHLNIYLCQKFNIFIKKHERIY